MNPKGLWLISAFILVSILLTSCTSNQPAEVDGVEAGALPVAIPTNAVQTESAFDAYPIANNKALSWNENAVLYQIPVTSVMDMNLGMLPGVVGWFYMFKVPDSPVEYYVEVVDGELYGATEAQPIIVEEPPYALLPIDSAKIIDSDQILMKYLQSGGNEYLEENPDAKIGYRLIHPDYFDHPVWTIFDVTDPKSLIPLYHINALTGEPTTDPFGS